MSDFDPGEGWRKVTRAEALSAGNYVRLVTATEGVTGLYWVPQEPVPPLPTEPYTVIRVTWKYASPANPEDEILLLRRNGLWEYDVDRIYEGDDLRGDITGFEVLAVPIGELMRQVDSAVQAMQADTEARVRRETAKAVLLRLREISAQTGGPYGYHLNRVSKEFGGDDVIDRGKAREALNERLGQGRWTILLDRLAECWTDDRRLQPLVLRERLKAFAIYASGRPAEHQAIEQGVQWITEEPDLLVQDWDAPTTPDPAQTIDRDALYAELRDWMGAREATSTTDRILALLRPDPRIAAIGALCDLADAMNASDRGTWRILGTDEIRAILRGA